MRSVDAGRVKVESARSARIETPPVPYESTSFVVKRTIAAAPNTRM